MRLEQNLGRNLSMMKIVSSELLKLIKGGNGGPTDGPALPQQARTKPLGG